MRLYCCILKGKTTTSEQFERFVKSFEKAWYYVRYMNHIKICPYFFINDDECVKILEKYLPMDEIEVLRRDDDPGELRNEFLARMQLIQGESEAEDFEYFTFFDGDDTICEHYFYQNYGEIRGRGFAIGNPVAVYGEEETDKYPLKWCLVAAHDNIYHATLLDRKGCQSWGNIYEMDVAKIAKFGRGLFEDVTFMYDVTRKYQNPVLFWDMEYHWYRNNPSALTRSLSTVSQIKDGMDNLDRAKNIARLDYDDFEPEVFRRYTIGVLTLIRNTSKISEEDRSSCLEYLVRRFDYSAFRFDEIKDSDKKFIDKLVEEFPKFYDWADYVGILPKNLGGVTDDARNGDSPRES